MPSAPIPSHASDPGRILWRNIILAALLMLGTLPGRTQGLALITEPMLADLALDRITYANINFWATLLGAAACLPAGWVLDRFGLRWFSGAIILALAYVVWRMSGHAGSVTMLFTWVLLTRTLGQSALSVASITAAGKGAGNRSGLAMGAYSVLIIVFFAIGFPLVGWAVRTEGWRMAWQHVALGLVIVIAPLAVLLLRETVKVAGAVTETLTGAGLGEALRTRAFWIFGGATALFNLVASGFGLFNESVLAEIGFDQETFHIFLPMMAVFTLVGQGLCGWLTLRRPMPVLLGSAMFLYALALALLPRVHARWQLWAIAALIGITTGFITVIFFAVWSQAYGRAHLGRIQGGAQMLTVLASAVGPELFARCHAWKGSYAPALHVLTPLVLAMGILAWRTKLPAPPGSGSGSGSSALPRI